MHRNRLGLAAPIWIAAAGLVVSVGVWEAMVRAEERRLASHFKLHAVERARALEHQLVDDFAALEALAALEAGMDVVTPAEFRTVSGPLLAKHPALKGLSWNVRVAHRERAEFEAACPALRGSPCRITERDEKGALVPARRRDHYTAVRLIEPYVGNEAALGFDVASEPRRLAAMTRASESGQISITAPIELVQDDTPQVAFLAFHPIYRKGASRHTEEERRRGIGGFFVGVFHVEDLVESAFARLESDDLHAYVYDDTEAAEDEILYSWKAAETGAPASFPAPWRSDPESLAHVVTVSAADRTWRVRFVPTPDALAGHRTAGPLGLLLAGLLLTGGVAGHVWRLAAANDELGREVDQRKQAEAELSRSEGRLRLALDSFSDGHYDWDIRGRHVWASDGLLRTFGYRREEHSTDPVTWEHMVHPDDYERATRAAREYLSGRAESYECELRLRNGAGEYRWILDRGVVVARDESGRPLRMIGTHTDVTERRLAEETARRLELKLQQAQKLESLGVLAGGIAHDFNNLLVGILGNADFALAATSRGADCKAEIEQIQLAATRAAELTRQMLAYAGKAQFAREGVDLSRLVREMAHLLEASVSKQARIELDLSTAPVPVEGDATQIRQVVMNLITNAAESLGREGGVVCVHTGIREIDRSYLEAAQLDQSSGPGRFVCLEVRDTGSGMSDDVRSRIFDPFFTTKFQGRGLGLAAVLGIVSAHRGAIRVDSEPGRGTTFTVLLPLADSAGAPAPGPRARAEEPGWKGSGTVLVVDDEAAVRAVASQVLRRAGFEVLTAGDGDEALAVAREHRNELRAILLDLTMPGRGGVDTFRTLRTLCSAPVILSSGYAPEECLGEFGDERPVGFLQKPFRGADLIEALRASLAA